MSSAHTLSLRQRLNAATSTIEKLCSICGAAGLSVGVSQGGEMLYEHHYGFADPETQARPSNRSVYRIGSMSKAIIAAGMARLVDDGRLDWHTPLHKIVPEFSDEQTITRRTKLRSKANIADLLAHRLGTSTAQGYWVQQEQQLLLDKSETATVLGLLEPVMGFREKMQYVNWGYAMAGEIIEKFSGQGLETFLQEAIFKPLGLLDTTFAYPDEARQVTSHITLADGTPYKVPPPPLYAGKLMAASGAGKSSLSDLIKLYTYWLNVAKNAGPKDDPPIIRRAQDLWTPRIKITENSQYGFGWVLAEVPGQVGMIGTNSYECPSGLPEIAQGLERPTSVIYHNGSMAGALSAVYLLPETDIVCVILSNTLALGDTPDWVAEHLVEVITDCPTPTDFIKLASETAVNAATRHAKVQEQLEEERRAGTTHRALEEYCGRYYNVAGNFFFDIQVHGDDGLRVLTQGLPNVRYDLHHYQDDIFAWPCDRDAEIERVIFPQASVDFHKFSFLVDNNGNIAKFRWGFDGTTPDGEIFQKDRAADTGSRI